jgi:hypothetical protein
LRVVEPPQPIPKTLRKISARNKTEVFIGTPWSARLILHRPRVCCHVRTMSNRATAHCLLLVCQCQPGAGARAEKPFRGPTPGRPRELSGSERSQRIDAGCPPCRKVARRQSYRDEQSRGPYIGHGIGGAGMK